MYEKSEDGSLVLPQEYFRKEFDPKYPLECLTRTDRDEVGLLLKKLINKFSYTPFEPNGSRNEMRKRLIRNIAKELMGPDWECEELT